jgi:chromosome segregation ATPase
MSARQKELEARVASLRSELELSAFLNKGVLQTNSELKLRIVELEQENAALRTAESRLARTEDKLEAAERRLEKREREWEISQAQWEEGLQRESELREGLEAERDEIRDEMEKWRFAWEGARKAMASLDAMNKAEKSEKTSARTTPTMPRTQASRNSMSGMASAGRRVTPSANSSARAGPSSVSALCAVLSLVVGTHGPSPS